MALGRWGKSMELNSSNLTPDPAATAPPEVNTESLPWVSCSLMVLSVLCVSSHLLLQSWWGDARMAPTFSVQDWGFFSFGGSPVSGERVRLFSCCCGAPGAPASAPWIHVLCCRLNSLFICVSESLLEKKKISFVYFSSFFFEKQSHDSIIPLIFIFKKMYLFWVARGKYLLGDRLIKNPHTFLKNGAWLLYNV